MNEKTKEVLLNRVFILNRDIDWNTNHIINTEATIADQKRVLAAQEAERADLITDLKEAGVEVDVPVQD